MQLLSQKHQNVDLRQRHERNLAFQKIHALAAARSHQLLGAVDGSGKIEANRSNWEVQSADDISKNTSCVQPFWLDGQCLCKEW